MTRTSLPFAVADTSALARSLKKDLDALGRLPGHLELLNMLARAAGHGNFQHFRARSAPRQTTTKSEVAERALRHFDAEGRLLRWPSRSDAIELALWVLWSRLPWNEALDERAISALLDRWHVFGDHALLRRALCDFGYVDRTVNGREYRRRPRTMPPEAIELLHRLRSNLISLEPGT